MRSLLSSVHNRQLRLVEYLNRHKNGASIDTLTEILDCSERLLREDITDMNKNSDCLTIVSEKKFVSIQYESNKNIDSVIQYMFENTSGFQILEYIFNDENLMTAELASLCGVSSSTIYRTVNKINDVLDGHYGITVTQNPYRLAGDERKIRNFYTHYFIEKYLAYPWPFPAIDELKFEAFFKNTLKSPISNFSFSEFRFIKISAAVSYIRYMNGHSVDFKNMHMNEYFIRKINSMCPAAKCDHEKFLNRELDMNFVRQLFHPYVVDGFYISYEDLIEGASVNSVTRKSAGMIEGFITELTDEFKIAPPNIEKLTLELHNICYLGHSSNHRNYVIKHQSVGLLDTIKKLNPIFFKRIFEEVDKYMIQVWDMDSEKAVNNAVYALIASWNDLYRELHKHKKPVTALICSIVGNFQAEMIKELVKYEFHDKLTIDIYNGVHFRIKEIEALGYDICITDFSIDNTDCQRCVCFNDMPSDDDLLILKNMITEIQHDFTVINT